MPCCTINYVIRGTPLITLHLQHAKLGKTGFRYKVAHFETCSKCCELMNHITHSSPLGGGERIRLPMIAIMK
jgi:hypothetical protein